MSIFGVSEYVLIISKFADCYDVAQLIKTSSVIRSSIKHFGASANIIGWIDIVIRNVAMRILNFYKIMKGTFAEQEYNNNIIVSDEESKILEDVRTKKILFGNSFTQYNCDREFFLEVINFDWFRKAAQQIVPFLGFYPQNQQLMSIVKYLPDIEIFSHTQVLHNHFKKLIKTDYFASISHTIIDAVHFLLTKNNISGIFKYVAHGLSWRCTTVLDTIFTYYFTQVPQNSVYVWKIADEMYNQKLMILDFIVLRRHALVSKIYNYCEMMYRISRNFIKPTLGQTYYMFNHNCNKFSEQESINFLKISEFDFDIFFSDPVTQQFWAQQKN